MPCCRNSREDTYFCWWLQHYRRRARLQTRYRLSGGELQRVAIARVFLKNPPILLLDEATSAVDTNTESEIQVALEKLRNKRTTFVIAHRLSTIVGADRILVLHGGKIVEGGTHDELIKTNGRYKRLWTKQIGLGLGSNSLTECQV